jgi:hypothetical protein
MANIFDTFNRKNIDEYDKYIYFKQFKNNGDSSTEPTYILGEKKKKIYENKEGEYLDLINNNKIIIYDQDKIKKLYKNDQKKIDDIIKLNNDKINNVIMGKQIISVLVDEVGEENNINKLVDPDTTVAISH